MTPAEEFRALYHDLLWDNGFRSELINDHHRIAKPPKMILRIHGKQFVVEVEFKDDGFRFGSHWAVDLAKGAFCYEDPLGTEKLLELAKSIS